MIAPETNRMAVKLQGLMSPSERARRFKTEFAAKAIMVKVVMAKSLKLFMIVVSHNRVECKALKL